MRMRELHGEWRIDMLVSRKRWIACAATCSMLGGAIAIGVLAARPVAAADHNDPHRVQSDQFWNTTSTDGADPAADIADLFAWNQLADPAAGPNPEKDSIVLILSWRLDDENPELDPSVRYGIHVDVKGDVLKKPDSKADYNIYVRHGQDTKTKSWGVKIEGLPGTTKKIVGRVGEELRVPVKGALGAAEARVISSVFDDPFVFDFDGFFYGLSVGLGNDRPNEIADAALRDKRKPAFALKANRPFGFNNKNDTIAGINVGAVVIEMPLHVLKAKTSKINVWSTTARPAQ